MKTPRYLVRGSKIALAAPARKISRDEISVAVEIIEKQGFIAVYDDRLFEESHQFAGGDAFRAAVMQEYLDRDDIDAIFCARGGYGTIRIIDRLDFTEFVKKPKWVVGYSDVTVLHGKLQSLDIESLHASMPINFPKNSVSALSSLFDTLSGNPLEYTINTHNLNRLGDAEAEIVGGNLSVLYSMMGSDTFPKTEGKILFIEDLDEYLYHIDRMMTALRRGGKLNNLKGLIVGGMTQMHDNAIPFGKNAEEIVYEHVKDYDYPVCFNFPAGHFDDNRAVIMGRKIKMSVKNSNTYITFG